METFECTHTYPSGNKRCWTGMWKILSICTDFHELRIKGRGSSFDVVAGYCSTGNYLCIPSINVGCALTDWSDVFWNIERLSQVLTETDAVTIAIALNHYGQY
ncbi:MAG: DUF6618 family protein [Lachnospiraceae bacterium]